MKVNGRDYRTVWMEGRTIKMIDQCALTHRFEIIGIEKVEQAADAVRSMRVRGSPAIGATCGFGMALAALCAQDDDLLNYVKICSKLLEGTRPTAHDLF